MAASSTVGEDVSCTSLDTKMQTPIEPKCKDRFVGNVSNYAPLPEGFKKPIRRGNLVFNACFEGGKSGS